MTTLKIEAGFIDTWLHQNEADFTGDYMYGSLLDNFVCFTKRGTAFVYETFVNEWTSAYLIKFVPYKEDDSELWEEWEERVIEYLEEYGSDEEKELHKLMKGA